MYTIIASVIYKYNFNSDLIYSIEDIIEILMKIF